MKRMTYRISIIGSGNVASNLGPALLDAGHEIVQVVGRNATTVAPLALELGAEAVTDVARMDPDVQVILIAVQDDAIAHVADLIPETAAVVAHTSGSIGAEVLQDKPFNGGNFYPLQTFSRGNAVDFSNIPILVEVPNKTAEAVLMHLGNTLSSSVGTLDSDQRRWLHIAAIFVNNFTNHCYSIADALCAEKNLSFNLLRPLMLETAKKAYTNPPASVQTGPAARGDSKVQEDHAALLASHPEWQKIYKLLSQSITDKANETQL